MNCSRLKIFCIVITFYLVNNKEKKLQLFEKTFLFAENSINIIYGISFFSLSNVIIDFNNQKL